MKTEHMMQRTLSLAKKRGWRHMEGSGGEHYFFRNPNSNSCQVFISAMNPEQLIFKVTPRGGHYSKVKARLEMARDEIAETLAIPAPLLEDCAINGNGKPHEINIVTSLRHLWQSRLTQGTRENRLHYYHKPLLLALEK